MILIDFSQLIHNNIYPIKEDIINDGIDKQFNFLKHRIINNILNLCNKYPNEKEIVLCGDGQNIWRTDFFSNYKKRRKLKRVDDGFPWNELWKHMKTFEKELIDIFPFMFIKIDRAEGDDVIGALTYYIHSVKPNENIIIISTDKDFKQLHIAKNIKQYSPKDKKEFKAMNAKNELMWLILKGDGADDVLNVKTTDEDTFINPNKRQITMWKSDKIWEHINNNTVMDELLVDVIDNKTKKVKVSRDQLLKNFKRNRKLVDLKKIPKNIQIEIVEEYENQRETIPDTGLMTLLKYFIKNKMNVMADKIHDFKRFNKINERNVSKDNADISSFLNS